MYLALFFPSLLPLSVIMVCTIRDYKCPFLYCITAALLICICMSSSAIISYIYRGTYCRSQHRSNLYPSLTLYSAGRCSPKDKGTPPISPSPSLIHPTMTIRFLNPGHSYSAPQSRNNLSLAGPQMKTLPQNEMRLGGPACWSCSQPQPLTRTLALFWSDSSGQHTLSNQANIQI